MKINKITIGRLFNLGNYEHVRYEITCEISEGDSAATAVTSMEKILAAMNPKRPGSIRSKQEIARKEKEIAEITAQSDEEFAIERSYIGFTKEEYLGRCQTTLSEDKAAREKWVARSKTARTLFDDLGGAEERKDAKLDWDDDEANAY